MIIILTGPAGSGKNTIANLYARSRTKGADIDVDLLRWMYRQPHVALWEGEEGFKQLNLGTRHACLLAKSFSDEGCDVAITDILTNETAQIYREILKEYDYKIVKLNPTWDESLKRLHGKGTITDEEAKFVYDLQTKLTDFDKSIDNTNLTPEEVLARIKA